MTINRMVWGGFVLAMWLVAGTAVAKERVHEIRAGETPFGVAKRYGVSVDALRRYNGLSEKSFPVGKTLRIPPKGTIGSEYVVKRGDSLAGIADFFGVSQSNLRRLNGIGRAKQLKIGQRLQIPSGLRDGLQGHVVRKGDTLARVAKKYKVSVKVLAAENKISLSAPLELGRTLLVPEGNDGPKRFAPPKANKLVKSGRKIRGGVMHKVMPGQTLWSIGRAYNVPKERIAVANDMPVNVSLQVGQEIKVPGAKAVVPVRVEGYAILPVHFVRVKTGKEIKIRLIRNSGKVIPWARKKLSYFSAPLNKNERKRLRLFNSRLIHMLQRFAERFPGRTFEIVSGFRPGQSGNESKHTQGRAIDFRIRGVANRDLFDFCKQLPAAGCGFYPNSVFIHMDAREKSATWTDYSAPGEKAQYQQP